MRPKQTLKSKYLLPAAPYYCVVDLEATCDERGPRVVPREEMETIEIGAVMVDVVTLAPVAEFQAFVRPVRHPQLTAFCTNLTSITQADVDQADHFPQVLHDFLAWANGFSGWRFCSWGAYDVKQIRRDCDYWDLDPPWPWNDSVNLKRIFAKQQGNIKECGIPAALSILGLPSMEGVHHRGLDDARNIARLVPRLRRPRVTDLSIEDMAALAAQAGRKAVEETRRLGLPLTGTKDGRIVTIYPDGREEVLKILPKKED